MGASTVFGRLFIRAVHGLDSVRNNRRSQKY